MLHFKRQDLSNFVCHGGEISSLMQVKPSPTVLYDCSRTADSFGQRHNDQLQISHSTECGEEEMITAVSSTPVAQRAQSRVQCK